MTASGTRTVKRTARRLATAVLAIAAATGPAAAQVSTASTAAVGLADSYGAPARGFAAAGANPALLGLSGNPFFSLALPTVRAAQGLAAIGLSDLNRYAGQVIPREEREAWLEEITRIGAFQGGARVDASALALNVGPVAFQHSSYAVAHARLSPDAAELLLFGNSGLTGVARDFSLDGSTLDAAAFSTLALAMGMPVSLTDDHEIALGATLTYTMGHGLAMARDLGSRLESDPVSVSLEFPLLHSSGDGGVSQGSGFGADLGVAYESATYTWTVAARNVFNTFHWDVGSLEYRPGEASFAGTDGSSDFDPQSAGEAPPELLAILEDHGFDRALEAAGAYRMAPGTTLVAEIKRRFGDGIPFAPSFHLGVGAEREMAEWLALRAGLAAITDGYRFGGGLTFLLGPAHLSAAWLYQAGDAGTGHHLGVGLSFNQR